jgi:hypothetical protein
VGEITSDQAAFEHTFAKAGFYRLGLTVQNGVLADLAWRDLIITEPVAAELGTEQQAQRWGFELEGDEGRGRVRFLDDADSVVGKTSLSFIPNPYPGQYVTAIYPQDRAADWDVSGSSKIRFWIKAINPNLPGFQNAAPVVWLYSESGSLKLEPSKNGNLFSSLPFSEARWSWMPVEIPLSGDGNWKRTDTGLVDPTHVTALGISLDSWGWSPFTVWIDGLSVE